jgi:AmiR/NasT family two-component response regulator
MEKGTSTNGPVEAALLERLAALETENEQLRTALESRITLEQAKGAISVRCDVPVDVAFEMLRGLAQSQGREIHEFAAEVLANGGRLSVAD